jgi:hypothetical protein
MPVQTWSSTVDWICLGSGAGGCAAALAGQAQGLTVLLVERSAVIGGTTAQSGGILWAPMNYLQQEAGLADSRQEALAYLRYTGAGENRPAYMEVLVDEAARVLAALHTHAQIEFRLLDLAEFYYPMAPGSKAFGRLVTCAPFPAATLGIWRDKVRLSPFYHSLAHALPGPNPALGGSAGPQVGHSGPLRHQDAALEPWRQRPDWSALAARLHEDEAHRVAGAALAGYLFRAVLQRGIAVRTACDVESLLVDQGRVVGLTLTHQGRAGRCWGLCRRRHLLNLKVHIRIPALEDGTQLPVERLHARLQQQMCTGFGPLHLLFFTEAFAHHLIHRGLHKTCRDRLSIVIPLPVIRYQVPVVPDIRAQRRERLDQGIEPGIRPVEGRDG